MSLAIERAVGELTDEFFTLYILDSGNMSIEGISQVTDMRPECVEKIIGQLSNYSYVYEDSGGKYGLTIQGIRAVKAFTESPLFSGYWLKML